MIQVLFLPMDSIAQDQELRQVFWLEVIEFTLRAFRSCGVLESTPLTLPNLQIRRF